MPNKERTETQFTRLIGANAVAVTEDASPHGAVTVGFWEPELTDARGENGAPVRRSATAESAGMMADLAVAGTRTIAFADFHRLPGDTPEVDTNLRRGELITAVELPAEGFAENYTYLKVRDRHSYAFALVSVAVGLKMQGEKIGEARLALGGVAHKPWRDVGAEAMLRGEVASDALFTEVGRAIVQDARGFGHNDFKIELARRAVVRALRQAVGTEART